MTERERTNKLSQAHARMVDALAALQAGRLEACEALLASAAVLVADATPSVQLELFQDAPQRAVRA